MGYNISIGEAIFGGDKESAYITVDAEYVEHDTAPCFPNDPAGKGNSRSPGYLVWSEFCARTGLTSMFYGVRDARGKWQDDPASHRENPVLSNHPGFACINAFDVLALKHALDLHVAQHGELTAAFARYGDMSSTVGQERAVRARLIWLHYWCDWAVTNCEWPIIANS